MRKPEINNVCLKEFTDQRETNLKLEVVKKDFEEESVEVLLLDKEGEILESGTANTNGKHNGSIIHQHLSLVKGSKSCELEHGSNGELDEKELDLGEHSPRI